MMGTMCRAFDGTRAQVEGANENDEPEKEVNNEGSNYCDSNRK